jgi:Cu2+-exporting ATPase
METKQQSSHYTRRDFPVLGMTCAACAVSVESMLRSAEGVKDAGVNFASQMAWAEVADNIPSEVLQNTVRSIGYDLIIDTEDPQALQEEAQARHYRSLQKRTYAALALSVPLVILGMFLMDMPYSNWISLVLAAPVVFWLGRSFFINAWKQAKHGKANMDTLVALSTGVAFFFSVFNTVYPQFWHSRGLHPHVYFESAAVVIAFISLGKLLEERAKSNTSSAIKKLMGLQPKTVTLVQEDGTEQEIPVASVQPGQILLVKPGEQIPVDGLLSEGSSYVDESMISGEPVPVLKEKEARVFAGTINQKGSFRFRAEKVGGDTVLAQIIRMVQKAQGSKAPVQKLVDRIAGIFVPVVIGIAILTFIAWMIFGGEHAFTHALLASVTVLVIACPCALGLATPTAIMVGVGKGAEHHILIKDAESLELGYRVNAVILDKTGTITEGKPVVTDLIWLQGDGGTLLEKQALLSMESRSEHPLAEAIVQHFKQENISTVIPVHFESITGRGLKMSYEGQTWYAGNRQLLSDHGISYTGQQAAALQSQAKTLVYFASDAGPIAIIAIADKIKDSSKAAIHTLQERGIEVYMLTGDNEQTAKAVAAQTGILHYQAEVMPSEKADFVEQLQAAGKVVAMVGDGINDSQALAQADVSIAMGKGSDIAMDVAKITLIGSDLQAVPKALLLSRKTVQGIRQNLFWAFIYNLVGIPLAAGILYPVNGFLLDPMIAGAAMALSSVSVVANSLRLKNVKI